MAFTASFFIQFEVAGECKCLEECFVCTLRGNVCTVDMQECTLIASSNSLYTATFSVMQLIQS